MLLKHEGWCGGCVGLLRDSSTDAQEATMLGMLATMQGCHKVCSPLTIVCGFLGCIATVM